MNRTTASILRFMLRTAAVILPVALPMLIWYVWADPYKVLRSYDSSAYFPDPTTHPARLGVNKGLVTISNLERRQAAGHTYNAFIFGSSVSCVYDAYTWARLADSTDTAQPYHMDSASETLMSMADKAEYLHRTGHSIDYALIVLDPIILATETDDSPPVIAPPQLHKNLLETLKYHYTFFRASTNADFLKSLIPAAIQGQPVDNGRNPIFEPQPIVYDPVVNQESLPRWDSLISADPATFYATHPLPPVPQAPAEAPILLTDQRLQALHRIADILHIHNTDYRIIVAPNRQQVTLNPADLHTLRAIFGTANTFDYSTTLVHALSTDTLLYDKTHYRPTFALRLITLTYPTPHPATHPAPHPAPNIP